MANDVEIDVAFPAKLRVLFKPSRYKVLYGGRGSAKSWGVARALLTLGMSRQLRILCARELQKSIKDSVHRLLSDQISLLSLGGFYTVQQQTITGANGTEFIFEGLRHNTDQIKSYEGIDICWVEEAHLTSKASWEVLIPTIRKDDSEIWITFNPDLEEDYTYQRFVLSPPANAVVVEMTYRDNKWFPRVLKDEMEDLKERDHNAYLNVWEGRCRQAVEGAIYADEMHALQRDGRIMRVPYDQKRPVNTFWDLGYGDSTSIWFIQKVGLEYRAIDFYQNARKKISHYIKVLQDRGYVYGKDYLPHDARSQHLTGLSVEDSLKELGRKTEIVPRVEQIIDRINATRDVLPVCLFDAERCADGLQALRRYRYKIDPDTNRSSKDPLHDDFSHGADAFGTFATAKNVIWEVLVGDERGEYKADYNPFRGWEK